MEFLLSQSHFVKDFPCCVRIDQLQRGYPMHGHQDFIEIVIVLGGECVHQIGDVTFRERAGNVYVLQGDVPHGFDKGSADFSVCNIMYNPVWAALPEARLRRMPGYQALFVLEPKWRNQRGFKHSLKLNAGQMRETIAITRRMLEEQRAKVDGADCEALAELLKLIVLLSRAYAETKKPSRVFPLAAAVAHLETHFREKTQLDQLARTSHMSRRTLFRAFQDAFQQTPLEYLNGLRLREACRMLSEPGDWTVGEVASACGFEDSNYFSRCFRKFTGRTPRDWREQAKNT